VFAPVVAAAGVDPNAVPAPATVTAVQARLREIVTQCTKV
jgi:hypothetical protein